LQQLKYSSKGKYCGYCGPGNGAIMWHYLRRTLVRQQYYAAIKFVSINNYQLHKTVISQYEANLFHSG